MARTPSTTKSACVVMRIETEAARPSTVEEPGVLGVDRRHGARVAPVSGIDQERGHVVITLDDLADDGASCVRVLSAPMRVLGQRSLELASA
jgi:hypothetical protein